MRQLCATDRHMEMVPPRGRRPARRSFVGAIVPEHAALSEQSVRRASRRRSGDESDFNSLVCVRVCVVVVVRTVLDHEKDKSMDRMTSCVGVRPRTSCCDVIVISLWPDFFCLVFVHRSRKV
jgi:hypothetical protein